MTTPSAEGVGEEERGRFEDIPVEVRSSLIVRWILEKLEGFAKQFEVVKYEDGAGRCLHTKWNSPLPVCRRHVATACDTTHGCPWALGDQQGRRSRLSEKLQWQGFL